MVIMGVRINNPRGRELLRKNVGVCCVCRERGLGINIHHIIPKSEGGSDDLNNLAILCVKEHDQYHRPKKYSIFNHLDLTAEEIKNKKEEWERFVEDAKKENPKVLAVLNIFGDYENIHSMKLLFQLDNGKVIIERVYHLLSGPIESWIDSALDEIKWLGKNIKLIIVDKPLPVEYCPCCKSSYCNSIDSNYVKKFVAPDWKEKSLCSIYINPKQASMALSVFYNGEIVLQGSLHKCGDFLHYICDNFEERKIITKNSSIRTQATNLIRKVIADWDPGVVLIGTGNQDKPNLIKDLILPKWWEE